LYRAEDVHSSRKDAHLISQAKAGEIEAFGQLYSRYLDPIYRYIRSRVNEDQTAEDLTEETFIRAFKALDKYKERGLPFSAYLYRVAKNLLVDCYRRQKEEITLEEAKHIQTASVTLDEDLIRAEKHSMLGQAYKRLPTDYQEIIRLRVILGISTSEAAFWMERSEGATRVLLHRALNALRELVTNDES
jgi:RNA polymerase sigma-70 factor (ECF subfamily)